MNVTSLFQFLSVDEDIFKMPNGKVLGLFFVLFAFMTKGWRPLLKKKVTCVLGHTLISSLQHLNQP